MMNTILSIIFLLLFVSFSSAEASADGRHIYIIHVEKPPSEIIGTHRDWHLSFLSFANIHESHLVYSYSHVLHGFAARLTPTELEALKAHEGFIHAHPDKVAFPETTYTPGFLGLNRDAGGFWSKAGFGKGVIIGVVDSGITPEHPSFNGAGMPKPPSKWKGRCDFKSQHLCNNKLIGARSFNLSNENTAAGGEPFDDDGHGTHVAGIAAGRFVANASLLGSARGIAAGIAPEAHLAVYRVDSEADIVAGIDQAVKDGVDVISKSIGSSNVPLHEQPVAIAEFGAAKKGVLVSASAGNRGPHGKLSNAVPWILTVGATSIDRRITAEVKLGSGKKFQGESAYQPGGFPSSPLPLVRGDFCDNQAELETIGVRGKIVLCTSGQADNVGKGEMVKRAGGVAMVVIHQDSDGPQTEPEPHVLPASQVTHEDGSVIIEYMNTTATPTASIVFKGTRIGGGKAPAVAIFSSRKGGDSTDYVPGVLKPDIVGPGLNILSAWPKAVGPPSAVTFPTFNIQHGTSMACPHLSGVAALLKGLHPEWSPAMIKSAIMTTADITDHVGRSIRDLSTNEKARFYAMGAGQVNPERAVSPGLVYDIQEDDYVRYLCGIEYTDSEASLVAGRKIRCSEFPSPDGADLNYPAFDVILVGLNATRRLRRTATNVGQPSSRYSLQVVRPRGVTVELNKRVLRFSSLGEKLTYSVTFGVNSTELNAREREIGFSSEGHLMWISSDGTFTVRSPIHVSV